jgi:predicted RNA binding protein YcfA (HicA-like mRNA interferase family)
MKMPIDTPPKKVVKCFQTFGFVLKAKSNNSHLIMVHPSWNGHGVTVSIPNHKKGVKSSTLRRIISEIGMDRKEFLRKL